MRPQRPVRTPIVRLALCLGALVVGWSPAASRAASAPVAVLPFRVHSAQALGDLPETLRARLVERLAAAGVGGVVESAEVHAALAPRGGAGELSDATLRSLARSLGARAVVSTSLTELAGRFSLDIRLIPAAAGARSHTIVFTAGGREALLQRVVEAADRISASLAEASTARIQGVSLDGAAELETELRQRIRVRPGDLYDPVRANRDARRLEAHPAVASASFESDRSADGVTLRYRVVRGERIFGTDAAEETGERVVEVRVRGNRRIDREAILARVRTRPGERLRAPKLASDVRDVFGLGFFRNVRVFRESVADGVILTFEVVESPVVRQIAISGNENVDTDDVREALTLTTGATLDYPLLYENVQRIEALYRAQGYFLADVHYEIEELAEGSIAIDFEVEENEKLRLKKIVFEGNEFFDDGDLSEDFATKTWRLWSPLTSWFDQTGTYSEPLFMRDLREVEKKYTNAGYLQVVVSDPEMETTEDGLVVRVKVSEGDRFRVGKIDLAGDDSVDIERLRGKLRLTEGEIFNRSHLTDDSEVLEKFYTDRGFFFANVSPDTRVSDQDKTVDVDFRVEKGPLYFIRHVNISGNTRTVDPVIRRELRTIEGQLYSARSLQVSTRRIESLGFFEDVNFEPVTTEDPSLLDLQVSVVERPTGSFSLGAGFSSQDRFVFNASLSQANLFGRGYATQLSADVGGRTTRIFLSVSDPYFLGSSFSLGTTFFLTSVRFQSFEQKQLGFDVNIGHALREDNTARGFLRYSFSSREVQRTSGVNAAAVIFRQILQGNESISLLGASMRSDTRNDRFAPTAGSSYGVTLEFAGLGGFSNFLRVEARQNWFLGAPDWLFDRSTFVVSSRIGYVRPLNDISDFSFPIGDVPGCDVPGACVGLGRLDQIDRDLKLPLTERYFLGGIGIFQLRGFKGRSVGPRRAILRRSGLLGTGNLFVPVGARIDTNPVTGSLVAVCDDRPGSFVNLQGNENGRCNRIGDRKTSDFDDLRETDVIGGNKFIAASFEYRFPVSEEAGLQGILFVDAGNAFAEGDTLFDPTEWRYGFGGGVLWFSPFGPLQLVLGWPIDPISIEKSPVFEFSVGGFGL